MRDDDDRDDTAIPALKYERPRLTFLGNVYAIVLGPSWRDDVAQQDPPPPKEAP